MEMAHWPAGEGELECFVHATEVSEGKRKGRMNDGGNVGSDFLSSDFLSSLPSDHPARSAPDLSD
eukprot:7011567-Prorocentrum_lima.AAC.1